MGGPVLLVRSMVGPTTLDSSTANAAMSLLASAALGKSGPPGPRAETGQGQGRQRGANACAATESPAGVQPEQAAPAPRTNGTPTADALLGDGGPGRSRPSTMGQQGVSSQPLLSPCTHTVPACAQGSQVVCGACRACDPFPRGPPGSLASAPGLGGASACRV